MKALADKIKEALGKNHEVEAVEMDHPNFWMYR